MVPAENSGVDITEVWLAYKKDPKNLALRNQLIEHYLPLVRYHAQRVWQRLPDGVDIEDIKSSGNFGLVDAIESFDLSRDVKFETYCAPRIRGAMLDELRNMDWVPRLVRTRAKRITEAVKVLDERLGRKPSDQELAEFLELTPEEFDRMAREANATSQVSLHKKWSEADSSRDISEIDLLEDAKGENPTSRIQKTDTMRLVTRGLKRNERLIILLYYYQDMTMKEIGLTLDLSESRVSQIHSAIMERLKIQLIERQLEFADN